MTTSTPSRSPAPAARRGAHLLSTLLFLAAIGFAGAAVYLYVTGDAGSDGPPPPPTAAPGRNEAATVMQALRDAGLEAEYGRYTATANQLDPPGQAVEIGDAHLYVFIYVDQSGPAAIAAREDDTADLDPQTLTLESRSARRPLTEGQEVHVFEASNIVGILVGGDDELVDRVGQAFASLP